MPLRASKAGATWVDPIHPQSGSNHWSITGSIQGIQFQPTKESAEERCGEEPEQVVRLAGIEPTTLGFGGQYSIH